MSQRALTLVLAIGLLIGSLASVASANPPRPGTEGNGLDENESATLWARDNDSRYITNAEYERAYDENRTAVQEIANRTDVTFRRPPATAGVWTRNDFADYTPGNESVSVYPTTANRTNSTMIRDAHATVFAAMPSTVVHTEPGETTRYLATEGELFGAVDYRVVVPDSTSERLATATGNRATRRVSWSLTSHEITAVRLRQDGRVIARTNGSHTPRLDYTLSGRNGTLTLAADIEARLRKQVTITRWVNRTLPNGTSRVVPVRETDTTVVLDSVTVSDRLPGRVYDLDPSLEYARYPDGELGVAVFQDLPWQGYAFRADRTTRVRGIWRFYTARVTGWDTLVRSRADGSRRVTSDALPVAVHAYPSRIGPRLEPEGRGPEQLNRWGEERPSPAGTLDPNVTVEVVEGPYEATHGLAVRYRANASEPVTIRGIVRGENRTLRPSTDGRQRTLRRSNLTVERVSESDSHLTIRITLRDAVTGEPIVLSAPDRPRYEPLLITRDDAYVSVGDRRVTTNLSGMATVRIEKSGVYTVRYHPESWLTHDPSYARSATSVRWHPLATVAGWLSLGVRLLQWFLPFAVALYAGRRLGGLFRYRGEL
jgi:hypothetical protein